MDDGETTGGLQAKTGGAPVTTAAFSKLEGESAMWPEVEMWPTETLQGELTARSWTKRGSAGGNAEQRCRRGLDLGRFVGQRERREAVPRRGLGLGESGGWWERMKRCRRGVLGLGKAVAGENAVRRCRGGVLVLDKAVAGGKAVRRSGGGGMDKARAEGKDVKRPGGGVRGSHGGHKWPSNLG